MCFSPPFRSLSVCFVWFATPILLLRRRHCWAHQDITPARSRRRRLRLWRKGGYAPAPLKGAGHSFAPSASFVVVLVFPEVSNCPSIAPFGHCSYSPATAPLMSSAAPAQVIANFVPRLLFVNECETANAGLFNAANLRSFVAQAATSLPVG